MQENIQNEEPLIEVENLVFGYGKRLIFDQISLTIPKGKVTVIMGPSGCGKSTMLKFFGGSLTPFSGDVVFDGISIPRLKRQQLFDLRKRMGMMFQSNALLTDINVFENVAYPLREHTDLSDSLIRHLVLLKLQMVGLRGARDLMPAELSGGMARRVALARAIALDPDLVMYDEPFTGLDPISMGVAVKLIKELNEALGTTSVVVTHDVPEGAGIADYIYLLGEGHVVGHGTPEQMMNSENQQVNQFMKGLPDGPVAFHYPAEDIAGDLLGLKQ